MFIYIYIYIYNVHTHTHIYIYLNIKAFKADIHNRYLFQDHIKYVLPFLK